MRDALQTNEELRSLLRSFVRPPQQDFPDLAAATADLDTTEKIADWVRYNIVYVSKYGINDFNDPEKTFALKRGNCAEMAKLTFHFLESRGCRPSFLVIQLLNNDAKNHVVCVFPAADGGIDVINNGRYVRGFASYRDIAADHDQGWWRYLVFGSIKNFNALADPVEEVYRDPSSKPKR